MSGRGNGRWVNAGAGVAAVAACAVCCAPWLIAAAGAVGVGAAAAAVWVPALAVLSAVAFAAAWLLVRRRRAARATCDTGPVDLGFPSVRTDERDQESRAAAARSSR